MQVKLRRLSLISAWETHEAKNYAESSRQLTEHLALYADKNTDNRGRAGYWAARDSERAGKLAEARALYEGMQARYDANWYGYLAKQRLDALGRTTQPKTFAPDSMVAPGSCQPKNRDRCRRNRRERTKKRG